MLFRYRSTSNSLSLYDYQRAVTFYIILLHFNSIYQRFIWQLICRSSPSSSSRDQMMPTKLGIFPQINIQIIVDQYSDLQLLSSMGPLDKNSNLYPFSFSLLALFKSFFYLKHWGDTSLFFCRFEASIRYNHCWNMWPGKIFSRWCNKH